VGGRVMRTGPPRSGRRTILASLTGGAVLASLLLCPLMAQRTEPDADRFPEPASVPHFPEEPVVAPKAMVAAAHPLASRAGVQVLRDGGNAIDALVAVQLALNVVEPQSSGLGGGCFILYYDAAARQTYCIDGREELPEAARRADFLDANGKVRREALTGGLPVGVPGTVAAMWLAHSRWGKLPIARVLEPAGKAAG